jgi:hypothetical protein
LTFFYIVVFEHKTDFLKVLPENLDEPFTNKILAKKMGISIGLGQKNYLLFKENECTNCYRKEKKTITF